AAPSVPRPVFRTLPVARPAPAPGARGSMSLLLHNAAQVVCVARRGERGKRGDALRDPALLRDASVLVEDGRIAWGGPAAAQPWVPADAAVIDCAGKVVLPGFVDSHTHLLFAGSREDEFEQRLQGRTYQEIAAAGGGINATVRRVRAASRDELRDLAR